MVYVPVVMTSGKRNPNATSINPVAHLPVLHTLSLIQPLSGLAAQFQTRPTGIRREGLKHLRYSNQPQKHCDVHQYRDQPFSPALDVVTDTNNPSHVPVKVHVSPVIDTRPKHLCHHVKKQLVKSFTNPHSVTDDADD